VIEYLLHKYEALSSNPSMTKKKKKLQMLFLFLDKVSLAILPRLTWNSWA
jgi:hypothetical protein